MIVDYFILSSCFDAMGTFSVGLNVLVWRCAVCVFPRISPFGASKCEKKSGLAGAHGHRGPS